MVSVGRSGRVGVTLAGLDASVRLGSERVSKRVTLWGTTVDLGSVSVDPNLVKGASDADSGPFFSEVANKLNIYNTRCNAPNC